MTIYQNAQDKFQALFHMRETLSFIALIWIKKIKVMFNLTMELLDLSDLPTLLPQIKKDALNSTMKANGEVFVILDGIISQQK
jgi:hypothetical protein